MHSRPATIVSLALLLLACGSSRPPTPPAAETENTKAERAAAEEAEVEATPVPEARVYVVRHAEKQGGEDPGLTEAGHQRAEALAALLADEELAAIVTTHLRRTQETAAPTAGAKGIEPTVVAIADDHAAHIEGVARAARDAGGHVLIVGHSNTVPDIVAGLGAERPEPIDDGDYDNLFVVTLAPDGSARVERRALPAE